MSGAGLTGVSGTISGLGAVLGLAGLRAAAFFFGAARFRAAFFATFLFAAFFFGADLRAVLRVVLRAAFLRAVFLATFLRVVLARDFTRAFLDFAAFFPARFFVAFLAAIFIPPLGPV